MTKIPHAFSLGIGLAILWLLLSGHYVPLLLSLGLMSVIFVVCLARRMDVADHEAQPVHLRPHAVLAYWGWLLRQIILSSIDVCRRIISPGMPISPTIVRIHSTQSSDLGRVIYANSITLTPGTISIDVRGEMIEVHALTGTGATDLEAGEMNRRVTRLETGS